MAGGGRLRAAQHVEREDRSTSSGTPGMRIAPAQVGSSERLTSPPVLQTHPLAAQASPSPRLGPSLGPRPG